MDSLNLLAEATNHPLAGVGHRSSSYHQPSAPFHPSYPPTNQQYHHHQQQQSYAGSPESQNSPHGQASTSSATTGKKKSRKSSAIAGNEEEGEGQDEGARKKSKQSLSCGECKRRKIKCDRKIPCSSCIKRGAADSCNWEDAKIEPEKQPFALVDDVTEMRERLGLIERFLNTLPPPLKASMRELGIKSFGQHPKNDIKQEQILDDECVGGDCPLRTGREAPNDSLGVLDTVLFSGVDMKGPPRIAASPPELTRAFTSITAPLPIYHDASSATNLGLDMCYSQEELDSERVRALERVFRILPNKEDAKHLIQLYFTQFEWFFKMLHRPSFEAEVDRFWEMVEAGRRYDVDPAWLALFYLILALGSDNSLHMSFGSPLSSHEDWTEKGRSLQAAAQRLMNLSDCMGRPQVRIIQCTLLLACWTLISAQGGDYGRFSSWLACAIRTGQKLGLHRLTTSQEDMPPDDAAWPPGKNSIKREGALRLWGFLTFFDHMAASARFKCYMINPAQTTTPPLSNINSIDLSPTEWKFTPLPSSVLTDASLEAHKLGMAQISRKTFDALVTGNSAFSYGIIMQLDREYRELLAAMPDAFLQEFKALEEKDPIIRGKRYIALQGVHNRIVRLHRPFLVKGWTNPKFAFSTDACIKSAKIVLVSHHNNLDVNRNLRMMYSHTLTASIVLAADLFHSIDTGAPDAETESKRDTLAMALEVFSEQVQDKVSARGLKITIESSRRVLTGLFFEQEKRRARRTALGLTGQTSVDEKPFAEILHQLASQFDHIETAMLPSQPANGSLILSPALPQPPAITAAGVSNGVGVGGENPLGSNQFWNGVDLTLPASNVVGADASNSMPMNSFASGLFQDLGLIPYGNGQSYDYWSQPQAGNVHMQGLGGPGGGGGSTSSSSTETSPLDLATFLGVGGSGTTEDATQLLLTQMAGGW